MINVLIEDEALSFEELQALAERRREVRTQRDRLNEEDGTITQQHWF